LCPRQIDFPSSVGVGQVRYYVESIDLDRAEAPFPWERFAPDKPILFCALGSQGNSCYLQSKSFFGLVLRVMSRHENWQMVLATGPGLSPKEFASVPPNVMLVDWAPQLTILKRASLMITHGGLGTIKECIMSGVPMIVFPLLHEQLTNAARVAYHRLGLRGDIRQTSEEQLESMMEQIDDDPSYRKRVADMRESFLDLERSGRGVKIIERIVGSLRGERAPVALEQRGQNAAV
jgi:MGT family glycosyltransferase